MSITEPINDNSISRQKSLETVSLKNNQIELVTKNYKKSEKQHNEITNLTQLTNIDKALQLLLADYIEKNLGKNIESNLRLRGGEGANFNIPASYDQTSNGLTITINIPPIWEGFTGEAAGESRGFNLFNQGQDIFNALGKGENYLKQGIDTWTGLGDTPLNADNIVNASKQVLSSTIGGVKLRSATIGNGPSSGGSEYCSPDCGRKRAGKFVTSTAKNARSLDVAPMNPENLDELHYAISTAQTPEADARGFNLGDIVNTADKYKRQFDTTYDTVKNISEQGNELFNSIRGVGSRGAPIADARTPYVSSESDARGLDGFTSTFSEADLYKHAAKQLLEQGRDVFSGFGGVGSRSAAISNAQKPCNCTESDARGLSFGDIVNTADKYKHQFDTTYDTVKNISEQGNKLFTSFKDVGSRSAAISNAQTPCSCTEADARGLSFGDIVNTADKYKHQFDTTYDTVKNISEQGNEIYNSIFRGVGSRGAAISNAQTPCNCTEADARGLSFGDIVNTADKYKHQFDTTYDTVKNISEQGNKLFNSFKDVGSRSAAISNAQTPCNCTEADARGLSFGDIVNTADKYKHQFDTTYDTVKNISEQGNELYNSFRGVGSRSAAISNAQTPCNCTEADARGLSFGDIVSTADKYKHQLDTTYDTVKNISEQGNELYNSIFRGVGSRGAPIADAKTPYVSSESDPRGFDFSDALKAAGQYKQQFDNAYNTGKSIAGQGHEIYDMVKGVGLRSAAIANQSHGENYCSPCGKQNASQGDSIKEQLDSAEARDSLLIDQVRQQQQARRREVTQMLGNR